jgi:uncharacterized protein (TIGR02453 family)
MEAKLNFESFLQGVINEIAGFDPILKGLEAKHCIFRINRDTRFSHDKSVYKTNMGGFIVRGGKKNSDRYPGYYVHVEPGNSFIAGGSYIPPAPWLNAIREKIDGDGDRLLKIVTGNDYVKYFGQLEGEKLKSSPKGYPKDHKYIELLKFKSFLAQMPLSDKEITGDDCFNLIISAFKAMKPLNDFLTI